MPDADDGFGDSFTVCRECTLFRANPLSRVYAAISGGTIIGPVIEVHVVQLFGTHGLEIEIPSPKNPERTSSVLISRGKSRFVDDLLFSTISHNLTSAELLKTSRKEVNFARRNRRLAVRKLVRSLILVPGNWMRTLSAFP